jgi:AcrR family transcriptional regulator
MGFERASMDLVAERAATSKRSLYAHFKSKDKLFLAIADLVRALFGADGGMAEFPLLAQRGKRCLTRH